MKQSTKFKIGLFSTILLFTVGIGSYQVLNWSKSYSKIEQKEIQNFDTLWSTVWDKNTKTFTPKLDQKTIQSLEQYATTPSQKQQLDLAKTSVALVTINSSNSTLAQFITTANQYYQNSDIDNNYPEQEKFNTSILQDIEALITSINKNIDQLTLNNNNIDFDKTITQEFQLTPISTSLLWKDLTVFNTHIDKINTLIKTQVVENNNRQKQESIINLKSQLDEFLTLTKQYEENIKSDYITIKDLKSIINTLSKIDPEKHLDWFTTIKNYDTNQELSYNTYLSDKFFTDNESLQSYHTQLSQVTIKVVLTQTISQVSNKSDESNKQTLKLTVHTSVNQPDNDLLNINSLKNISMSISQQQTIKKYVPVETSTTESTSDDTATTESSTEQSEPIPIRREQ